MDKEQKNIIKKAKRIVIKIGTSLLSSGVSSGINISYLKNITNAAARLKKENKEVILVTSGAVGLGCLKLNVSVKPSRISKKQALAAAGQIELMRVYQDLFALKNITPAQVLVTHETFKNRKQYLNALNALNSILELGLVPVVNENDTVAIDELKIGDNDSLAAYTAAIVNADLLVILTDVDGLYENKKESCTLIPEVKTINKTIYSYASCKTGCFTTGGMATKIKAAQIVTKAGIPVIITNGKNKSALSDIFNLNYKGTYFPPSVKKLKGLKKYIHLTRKTKGEINIDEGAARAVKKGKSLLPAGVLSAPKNFSRGDFVKVLCGKNHIADGLVNYSSEEVNLIKGKSTLSIKKILGYKTEDEIIHADNLIT